MQGRLKNYALATCLFVFLFVIIGAGLHLNPGGAFLAAGTGTPLVIYAFRRRSNGTSRPEEVRADSARKEVDYVSSKTHKSD
jgi:peptidoglycan/LPS O-acetylase OafA/YrhL